MHQFTIDLPTGTNSDHLVQRIRSLVEESGGTFSGSGTSGSFAIKGVAGGFTVNNSSASITLSNKPWYVSYNMIESYIRKNISLAAI